MIGHTPFFSVIIPLFNKQAYILETLDSVFKQTVNDFEIIIVDDGSTDNSFKLISEFKDERLHIIRQENAGASIARNNGIANARGKYIALLDADDSWYSNHLFELKKQILQFPNAGLYCNNYEVYFSKDLVRPANLNFDFKNDCLIVKDFFKASITLPVAWTSAVGFSEEKFNSVNGFNAALSGVEDIDLWVKMALKHKVAFNPKITMSYKLYVDDSLSKIEFNDIRYEFISSYAEAEKINPSLKLYLDINRYALAIRCLLNNEDDLYYKLKIEIDFNNLNLKQKLFLKCPKSLLRVSKKFHRLLINNGLYLTAYN